MADLGDPLTGSTDFRVCLYDETAGNASLVVGVAVPSADESCATCWKALTSGYRYSAADRSMMLIMKANTTGRASIAARATVTFNGPASSGQLVNQDPRVIVQLVSSTGVCWESTFWSPPSRASATAFSDRSP